MNLYNNYCYGTIEEAATAELTAPVLIDSSGILTGKQYSVIDTDTVSMVYHFTPSNGVTPAYDIVHERNFAVCTQPGYLTNLTGLSITEVVEISFLVVLVWTVAFGFRAMRRSIGINL